MKQSLSVHLHLSTILCCLFGLFITCASQADENHHHQASTALSIENAWIRHLPGNGPMAAYFTIRNNSDNDIAFDHACSKAAFKDVMVHQSMQENGHSHMHAINKSINIPAHGELRFEPGGYHLMLMDRKQAIQPGDTVRVMLHFSEDEILEADFEVRSALAE